MIEHVNKGLKEKGALALASLCAFSSSIPANAATTPAGTTIANTATLTFASGNGSATTTSNTVSLVAAELLDVAIVAERPSSTAQPNNAVPFVITNLGNGSEEFVPSFVSDRSGVALDRIAIDTDNDGQYDAAKDKPFPVGETLPLTSSAQVRLFVLIDGGQITATTTLTATVVAKTGSGPKGTVFTGQGNNGGDAVTGASGASATASAQLTILAGAPSLAKSQSVFAPDGSGRAVRGAIITYRLVASFSTATRGVAIDDPIPAGTDYLPGSLILDDRPLSDATDADAGNAGTAGVHVALGDVAPGATRTMQFSVKIQ